MQLKRALASVNFERFMQHKTYIKYVNKLVSFKIINTIAENVDNPF